MARNKRHRLPVANADLLQDLYEQVPDVDCSGRCHTHCVTFPTPAAEAREIARQTRPPIDLAALPKALPCPALQFGRCAVYPIRPLLCRIWGASELYRCVYGCTPANGVPRLTVEQTMMLMAASFDISGQHAIAAGLRTAADSPDLPALTSLMQGVVDGRTTLAQAWASRQTAIDSHRERTAHGPDSQH